jgi:MFS family permease
VTTVAAFLAAFSGSSVNVALPSIGRDFGMSAVALNWVATTFLLAAAVALVPAGKIADMLGRKALFGWGSLVYALASLATGLARSAPVLLASRAVQGLGAAMIFATGVAILTSAYPQAVRGRVLGINIAATSGLPGTGLGGIRPSRWLAEPVPHQRGLGRQRAWRVDRENGPRREDSPGPPPGASLIMLMLGRGCPPGRGGPGRGRIGSNFSSAWSRNPNPFSISLFATTPSSLSRISRAHQLRATFGLLSLCLPIHQA